jgi:hypothetical protein
MRPILLSGHERALTQVKYNADGDLIFSVSKDHVVCAWCMYTPTPTGHGRETDIVYGHTTASA